MKKCPFSGVNKVRYLLSLPLFAISLWLLASCDVASTLSFIDGTNTHSIQTSNGTVNVKSFYFQSFNYLYFDLKGNYEIDPDSLLVAFDDERLSFLSAESYKTASGDISNRTSIENSDIQARLAINITGNNVDLNRINMYILPCNYLLCEGKPILTDTLIISLRCHIKNFFWEKPRLRPIVNRKKQK